MCRHGYADDIPRAVGRYHRDRLALHVRGAGGCVRPLPTACLTIETDNNDNIKPVADGPSPWTAGLDVRAYGGSVPRLVQAAGCAIWSPFWRNATGARIAESHALGLKVLPWTVNDPADMARLIDAGVDGIITDYPDRLRRVMADKGLPLP